MESWYTKLFSMTLVKVKMHLEGLNGWNEIVKPKKLKVIVWKRKWESHLTFFSKPDKTCNYQYCKWWLYIISNQPQQPAVQINLILATHFGNGTDLRRSPQIYQLGCFLQMLQKVPPVAILTFIDKKQLCDVKLQIPRFLGALLDRPIGIPIVWQLKWGLPAK